MLIPVRLPVGNTGLVVEFLGNQPAGLISVGIGGDTIEERGIIDAGKIVLDHLPECTILAGWLALTLQAAQQTERSTTKNQTDQHSREQTGINPAMGCQHHAQNANEKEDTEEAAKQGN